MNSQTSDQLMDGANSSHAENYSVNPFLWGNIALLTSLPWLLAMTMAGLAVGDPVFASWFEISLLSLPAIAVVAWWQWQQPFSPFSLWLVKQSFNSLSDRDRQVLALLKQHRNGWYSTGWTAIAVAIVMSFIFCKLYVAAPLAEVIAPFPAGLRFFGIIWAEIFFLVSNAIAQAGISALRIKLAASSDLASLPPIAIDKVKNSFTNLGKPVNNPISQPKLDLPIKPTLVLEPKSDDLTKPEPEVEEITVPEAIAELEPKVEEIVEIIQPEAIADDLGDVTELEPEVEEIAEIIQPEAIAEITTELEPELEETVEVAEPEVIAEDLGDLTELEPEVEEIAEIIQPEAIAEDLGDLTELEPKIEEIAEVAEPEAIAEDLGDLTELEPKVEEIVEIIQPEAIADDLVVATELEPETNYLTETVINFESDFDIDAEIAKMIAEEEAAKLANMTDWQPEINAENESALIATEIDAEIDEELEELVAFNAYTEQILHNYLTDEPIDEEAISENPDNKTYIATTDQNEAKAKPYQILIEEFLVDKYLAKLEELGRTEKLNPENLNPENLQPENNNE
ncbi:low-complexity tail membrane protein [Pseudanabaena sp. FACHB-1277]|uniref:Low-complexity tail membrane protein n=1 Tax=Pseudanabaena cinerea FACHB-1277 TaxID=2949581 RepID=A0A926UQW4_9CYAN|nr:low-complexity tail membrane protein [Pseudanabaena cinerea]MBD2149168.1 low-complexity tail membrane protein [Pseudanabaena cinerea FACHB-1277]